MDETASKDWKILLGTTTNAPPEPSLFDRVSLEIKKTDSTTAKTIAEPYLLESETFYQTAIVLNWLEKTEHCRSLVVREEFT